MKTATIIGSSGMTGTYLFKLLLQDKNFEKIRLIVRHHMSVTATNMEVVQVDFSDMMAFKNAIAGSNVVFCATGTTQKKVNGDKKLYRTIDFDIPVNAARFCTQCHCNKFVVVSAVGANAKSNNFYLRLKGEMENAVKASGLPFIYIMQPSMLLGNRKEKRTGDSFMQGTMQFFSFLLKGKLQKYHPIHAELVARAMVNAVKISTPGIFTCQYNDMMNLAKTGIQFSSP
jgi:uncharacterized protein YbjT (DUF2867 family)